MKDMYQLSEEYKAQWKHVYDKAREDRERYFNWIKEEINQVVQKINSIDKIYLLGGLGSRLIQASPTLYTQFLETYDGPDNESVQEEKLIKDDDIEVLLEYAMSIASASENKNSGVIPTQKHIDEVREQLNRIKINLSVYEKTADNPSGGNEFDHWLRMNIMDESLHVRGDGQHLHIVDVYKETFAPHNDFLKQYYGFDANDILDAINRFDLLITSKMGNAFGGSQAHRRFVEWSDAKGDDAIREEMKAIGKPFIQQFVEENPDLLDKENPLNLTLLPLDYIEGYSKLFWIIPRKGKEEKIFQHLSIEFGQNKDFIHGKFAGFPLGDTLIQTKPLIKVNDKYYCFSINLAFRNIFDITANLLQDADAVYYEQSFKGNSNTNSRDNYIEKKVNRLFESFLSSVRFYHSLEYTITENGSPKRTELDLLGVGEDALYIIEVKAGELNKKHKRGAIKGLKDRLTETVNEGSYQCFRAEKYILNEENPTFHYSKNGKGETLTLNKSKIKNIYKISVMYQHLAMISVNLSYLIQSGVLSPDYKWTWIVSLYDLMIFSDFIENEGQFKEYLQHRFEIYERDDVVFMDEIDILAFYLKGEFPLPPPADSKIYILEHKQDIDEYYTNLAVGMPGVVKPKLNIKPDS